MPTEDCCGHTMVVLLNRKAHGTGNIILKQTSVIILNTLRFCPENREETSYTRVPSIHHIKSLDNIPSSNKMTVF